MMKRTSDFTDSPALRFVLMMGVVNLFGDVTYEGGAAINGQFLGALGASAAAVSIIAGCGEFLGYALRSVSGYVADRTGRYWLVTFVGYAINLFAVPAMALAGSWQIAGVLIIAERIGRAIRKPTVEAMISYTTGKLGRGWAYGLNTALDETGATVGPLVIALVLLLGGDYRTGFAWLFVSAVLAGAALVAARVGFPVPARLEDRPTAEAKGFGAPYWLYMAAAAVFAAGLMSYELVAFHLARMQLVAGPWIPVLLALSTGCGVIANLVLGRLYDRIGLPVILAGVVLSALFAPLAFQNTLLPIVLAMPLWGVGYATQDTLLKAVIAGILPEGRRGLAFGLFYAAYGVGWLVGSIATGLLYERSLPAVIAFVVIAQLASLPLFLLAGRGHR
ncbi:MFS transporter [Mesorhizobium sp. B2-9-1]|uniref:MFS transporter n=1 Tax=Mesorhizobium sp. B2-9-1 TaxID=2589898 RepID=UPI001FEDC3B0|nr:MFS transporter [Mesorhizobium sp. B2-9-1]